MDPIYSDKMKELFIATYDRLFAYAKSALHCEALAEEAVQETFYIACRKPEELFACGHEFAWLLKTLRYVIANIRRSQETAKRNRQDYLTIYNDRSVSHLQLPLEVLYENVAQTEEYRLIRKVADGASCYDIAEAGGISYETCRKRIYRAKQALKKLFLKI